VEIDASRLDDGEVAARLGQLEREEHLVSVRRRRLHDRIDFLRSSGNADGTPASPEQMAVLDAQEREISTKRRELHVQIAAARGELRRRRVEP
jgi:hypothetical protein